MPPHDAERLALANEVRESLALENVLTPIQARSFVRSLQTTWRVPIKVLGISRSSAYQAARCGDLPIIGIGRRMLVPKICLETLLNGASSVCGDLSCKSEGQGSNEATEKISRTSVLT